MDKISSNTFSYFGSFVEVCGYASHTGKTVQYVTYVNHQCVNVTSKMRATDIQTREQASMCSLATGIRFLLNQ